MIYHHRCTNKCKCGARVQLHHKLSDHDAKCSVCNKGWLHFDPSVKKQRNQPGYYCTCNAFPFPKHRAGSNPLCERYTKPLTEDDYINYYGRFYT